MVRITVEAETASEAVCAIVSLAAGGRATKEDIAESIESAERSFASFVLDGIPSKEKAIRGIHGEEPAMKEKESKNDALLECASNLESTPAKSLELKVAISGLDELERTLEAVSAHVNEALDALKGLEQGVELGFSLESEPNVDLE